MRQKQIVGVRQHSPSHAWGHRHLLSAAMHSKGIPTCTHSRAVWRHRSLFSRSERRSVLPMQCRRCGGRRGRRSRWRATKASGQLDVHQLPAACHLAAVGRRVWPRRRHDRQVRPRPCHSVHALRHAVLAVCHPSCVMACNISPPNVCLHVLHRSAASILTCDRQLGRSAVWVIGDLPWCTRLKTDMPVKLPDRNPSRVCHARPDSFPYSSRRRCSSAPLRPTWSSRPSRSCWHLCPSSRSALAHGSVRQSHCRCHYCHGFAMEGRRLRSIRFDSVVRWCGNVTDFALQGGCRPSCCLKRLASHQWCDFDVHQLQRLVDPFMPSSSW